MYGDRERGRFIHVFKIWMPSCGVSMAGCGRKPRPRPILRSFLYYLTSDATTAKHESFACQSPQEDLLRKDVSHGHESSQRTAGVRSEVLTNVNSANLGRLYLPIASASLNCRPTSSKQKLLLVPSMYGSWWRLFFWVQRHSSMDFKALARGLRFGGCVSI